MMWSFPRRRGRPLEIRQDGYDGSREVAARTGQREVVEVVDDRLAPPVDFQDDVALHHRAGQRDRHDGPIFEGRLELSQECGLVDDVTALLVWIASPDRAVQQVCIHVPPLAKSLQCR